MILRHHRLLCPSAEHNKLGGQRLYIQYAIIWQAEALFVLVSHLRGERYPCDWMFAMEAAE